MEKAVFSSYSLQDKHAYFQKLFNNAHLLPHSNELQHYMIMTTSNSHSVLEAYFDQIHSLLDISCRRKIQLLKQYRDISNEKELQSQNRDTQECDLLLEQLN